MLGKRRPDRSSQEQPTSQAAGSSQQPGAPRSSKFGIHPFWVVESVAIIWESDLVQFGNLVFESCVWNLLVVLEARDSDLESSFGTSPDPHTPFPQPSPRKQYRNL